jgi:hypothetical protein
MCVAMQEGDEEEETDKLVQQVFAEIGISATEGMVSAPQGQAVGLQQAEAAAQEAPAPVAAEAEGASTSGVDDDLAARLEALRKT